MDGSPRRSNAASNTVFRQCSRGEPDRPAPDSGEVIPDAQQIVTGERQGGLEDSLQPGEQLTTVSACRPPSRPRSSAQRRRTIERTSGPRGPEFIWDGNETGIGPVCTGNVWPAPSASSFSDLAGSCINRIRPVGVAPARMEVRRPGRHNLTGRVNRHFRCQVARTPVQLRAISFPPPTDLVNRLAGQRGRPISINPGRISCGSTGRCRRDEHRPHGSGPAFGQRNDDSILVLAGHQTLHPLPNRRRVRR